MLVVAVSVPDIIKDIGSYAGFAAVVGLAVLAALYFSQARDVRRLRDWAGRAPERAAEEEERTQAAARAAAAAATQRAAATSAGARTAAGAAAAGAGTGAAATTPGTAAATEAGAGAGAGATSSGGKGGVATAPRIPAPTRLPSQQTAVLGNTIPSQKVPWYKRIDWPAPRYIALIVAGVLIVGGGAAFGVTKLLEEDSPSGQTSGGGTSGDTRERGERIDPADVPVSVLNGTLVSGLAAQVGDELRNAGFPVVNTDNASDQARNESVVLYTESRREAQLVARRLDIGQTERADDSSRALAGDATVIVVIGADRTQ